MADPSDERKFLKPVAWLGGRDLLANLKYFVLFAAFKGKLDPRDWMRAEVFPPNPADDNDKEYIRAFNSSFREDINGEFWFDYFADSGDGMTAGYALAYLSMSDLEAKLPPAGVGLSKAALAAGEIRSRLALKNEAPASMVADYPELAATPWLKQQLQKNKSHREIIEAIEQETPGVVRLVESDGSVTDGYTELPRGAFLFIGGDTCYHVADYAGLGMRFQKVFDWAFKDLKKAFNLTDEEAEQRYWTELKRRPIFGVPGNHDYYDMIDGFNRQFARPITREVKFINLQGRNMDPQLRLWAFKRFQTASYVAMKLPFGWWFWGVDSELKRVDIRQQEYFKRSYSENLSPDALQALREEVLKRLTNELGRQPTEEELSYRYLRLEQTPWGDVWAMPRKLIVATSEPTTVEGRRAREDDKTPQAFCFLDLAQPFMYRERNGRPKAKDETFRCRLDISGDVHHYARYWGTPSEDGEDDYASIVSGGGGASMSPTETDYDEVDEQALYPGKDVSTRVIHSRLFQPWLVIRGGNIWLAGLIFATVIYFGASLDRHIDFSNSVVSYVSHLIPFVSTAAVPRYVDLSGAAVNSAQAGKLALLLIISIVTLVLAGFYARWLFDRLTKTHDWAVDRKQNLRFIQTKNFDELNYRYEELLETIAYQAKPKFALPLLKQVDLAILTIIPVLAGLLFWAFEMGASDGPDWVQAVSFVLLSLAAIFVAWLGMRHSKSEYKGFQDRTRGFDERDKVNGRQDNAVAQDVDEISEYVVTPKLDYAPFWALLVLAVSTFSLAGWEFLQLENLGRPLTPFAKNTLLLISLVVAGTATIVGIYYSKWLFEQSYRIKVSMYSSIPAMTLSFIGVGVLLGSIWSFGKQPGRSILADVLYLFVLLALPAGCVLLAVSLGNHVPGFKRGIGFGLMGLWHGLLQLAVPVLLVWLGNGWAFVAAGITVSVFVVGGTLIAKSRGFKGLINPPMLTIVWVVYGLLMILIPFILRRSAGEPAVITGPTLFVASFITAGILAFSLLDFKSRFSIPIMICFAIGIPLVCWLTGPWLGTGILAGLIGSVMSCVWLGWYFATALVFHGHANEAGSTARTEEYKHFIRFKLTKDTLTGYVIAVDFPQAPQPSERVAKGGHKLKPRLVDVFTLKCNDNELTPWEVKEEELKEEFAPTTPS